MTRELICAVGFTALIAATCLLFWVVVVAGILGKPAEDLFFQMIGQ